MRPCEGKVRDHYHIRQRKDRCLRQQPVHHRAALRRQRHARQLRVQVRPSGADGVLAIRPPLRHLPGNGLARFREGMPKASRARRCGEVQADGRPLHRMAPPQKSKARCAVELFDILSHISGMSVAAPEEICSRFSFGFWTFDEVLAISASAPESPGRRDPEDDSPGGCSD